MHPLRLRDAAHVECAGPLEGGELGEGARLRGPVEEIGSGHAGVATVLYIDHLDYGKTVGIRIGEGLPEHGVGDAENGCGYADGQSHRDHDVQGESGGSAAHTEAVANVTQEDINEREAALIAIRFFGLCDASEFPDGSAARDRK